MSQRSATELNNLDPEFPDHQDSQTQETSIEFSLQRADGGKDAWLVLTGASFAVALIWAFALSFGIFQEHYTSLTQFRGQESSVAIVGTIANGLLYLLTPVSLALCRQFPHLRRDFMLGGSAILTCALVGASFATQIWHLILTQGILYAIGGSLVTFPAFLFIDEWFVKKRGFAYGVVWSSSGLFGLIAPYILSWLLSAYGFRTALRVWVIVNAALLFPLMLFIKPRLPTSLVVRNRFPRLRFAIAPVFMAFQISNIVQGLGYFLPGFYLPLYARSIGLSSAVATSSVALPNVGAFFGCIAVGFLVDRWNTVNTIGLVSIGSVIVVALMWGFCGSGALIICFALLYGVLAGSFSATWPGVVTEVLKSEQNAEASTVLCLLITGRGLGSVVSGPLSQALLRVERFTKSFDYGYGSEYGMLIGFTAITMAAGGFGALCRKLRLV